MARFRILVVDDNRSIHDDFKKILTRASESVDDELSALEAELFGTAAESEELTQFDLGHATQGKEGVELAREAVEAGDPYALAFVDMRMPPGWDGLRTIEGLWQVDPNVQVVICSAYSDYSWSEISERLGTSDQLLILKKPFDNVEVLQIAHALTSKWTLSRQWENRIDHLDALVDERTQELDSTNKALQKEIAERDRVEAELRLAQKLEAVGQLAAGIAHEINTPIQYVGNSAFFLSEAFEDMQKLIAVYRSKAADDPDVAQAEQEADIEFLLEEIGPAITRTMDGVERVSAIVKAMKEFAHPGTRDKAAADINGAIKNTLEVAANEYKYVAEVDLRLGELPMVECHISDLNQVLLNLIVNAAHAIEEVLPEGDRGTLRIETSEADGMVSIAVDDSGPGIPANIRDRVYDPFFTTKEVGKGSGQGLAIAHSIVVERHSGKIKIEDSELGGARFLIELPTSAKTAETPAMEAVA